MGKQEDADLKVGATKRQQAAALQSASPTFAHIAAVAACALLYLRSWLHSLAWGGCF
jgi:hypothetical protein